MATTPIGQYYRKAYQTFDGGLDDFEHPMRIKENQFATLDNALINYTGLLERSQGATLDAAVFPNNQLNFIRMMVNYKRGTSVDMLVVAASDQTNTNANYKVDVKQSAGDGNYSYIGYTVGTATFTNGSTSVTGSGTSWNTQLKAGDKIKPNATSNWYEISVVNSATSITLTASFAETTQTGVSYTARIILNNSFIPQATVFNNFLIITNGSELPYTWDNTTTNLLTSANVPRGKFIETHKNRVFMANTTGSPSGLFWSAALDQTTWSSLSTASVYPQDNGNIVCIKSFADSLIVLKDNGKIYQVIGNFDQDVNGYPTFIRVVDVPDNLGVISGYTPVKHDDGRLYFLAQTGIYAMDPNLRFEKVSWNINADILAATLTPGASANKSYTFSTTAQWNTGTLKGVDTGSNKISNFFDSLSLTNATKGDKLVSCVLDANNSVHVAYVDSANPKIVRYVRWDADTTSPSVSETPFTAADYSIGSLSIAVDSGGNPGIIFAPLGNNCGIDNTATGSPYVNTQGNGHFTPVKYIYRTNSTGTWSAAVSLNSDGGYSQPQTAPNDPFYQFPEGTYVLGYGDCSLQFDNFDYPWVAFSSYVLGLWAEPQGGITIFTGSNYSNQVEVYVNNTGTWGRKAYLNQTWTSSTTISQGYSQVNLQTNSGNPYLTGYFGAAGYLSAWFSTNGGTSFTTVENFTLGTPAGRTQLSLNSTQQLISGYVDPADGKFKKRNHSSATTTILDTTTTSFGNGYIVSSITSSDQDYFFNITGTSPNQDEKFSFESGTTITNPTLNVIDKSYRSGDKAFVQKGNTFATCSFGTNSNEIRIHRLSFRAIFQSPIESDTTLTQWGTYTIGGEVDNGATVTHSINLGSTNALGTQVTVSNNSLISTNATLIYAQLTITMVLATWAAPVIQSANMNYTGLGIGANTPTGYVFNNEIYFSLTYDGANNNDTIVFFDRNGAWGTRTSYKITFMCRFKNALWGGSALDGNVYKLNSGYQYNSSSYTTQAITKEDVLGSLELQKEIYKIYVIYKVQGSGSFNFSYRLDNYKGASPAWNTTSIDMTTNNQTPGIQEIPVTNGLFSSIQFKVDCSASGANMGVVGWVILYGYSDVR